MIWKMAFNSLVKMKSGMTWNFNVLEFINQIFGLIFEKIFADIVL